MFIPIEKTLKNNDYVEHLEQILLIVLFIYFQGKKKSASC